MFRHPEKFGGAFALCGFALLPFVPGHSAQAESVLYSFCQQRNCADGSFPSGGVIRTSGGNLVGNAWNGGADGAGAVYQLAPDGTETVLHSFATGSDGTDPSGGLIEDSAGNLYGTTQFGGTSGNGAVFKLAPDGTETLWSFGSWGFSPMSGVVMDKKGNLYGATLGGSSGYGVVFRLSQSGTFKSLYNFTGGSDGGNPSGLMRDNRGNLYGVASQGGNFGNSCGGSGCGTVFKISGTTEIVLYTFAGGTDGVYPTSGVIKDSAGNLYGTTAHGGTFGNGTVFEVTPSGTEKVLYEFTGSSDGNSPQSPLLMDSGGNLYGTTSGGGTNGSGVVFKLTPKGVESVLHTFSGGNDGAQPAGGLILHDKTLYGATGGGGTNGDGTVYKLKK